MSGPKAPEPAAEKKPRAKARKLPSLASLGERGASAEARRLAALLLEVLGGLRTPTEVAAALGVSLPRYYALEGRALEGFLAALEPRRRGPRRSPEREAERLRGELERKEREFRRAQACLRAQERALGLKKPERAKEEPSSPGKRRRRRRPTARALRAVRALGGGNPLGTQGAGKEDGPGVKAG